MLYGDKKCGFKILVKKKGLAKVLLILVLLTFFLITITIYQTSVTHSRRPTKIQRQIQRRMGQAANISCDRSNHKYDICSTNGPTILEPTTFTFWTSSPNNNPPLVQRIKPYPRKFDKITMGFIEDVLLISSPTSPSCTVHHSSPALVFTVSMYTQNFFHDFIDAFIPLFITTNTIFPNQEFIIVILQAHQWWINKYIDLLRIFTNHSIINLADENVTHCFPSVTVGLMSHGPMIIDSKLIPNSKNLSHFRASLEIAYYKNSQTISKPPNIRPRMVLASRSGHIGRVILNLNEVRHAAEEAGFEVIIFEPRSNTSLRKSYELINSCHIMVGVHGAALTHLLFLRPEAVFIQIVPIGVEREAKICFGRPSMELRLKYMEYKIDLEESSLLAKHGNNSMVVKDPMALLKKVWSRGTNGGEKNGEVNLDFGKFKEYLKIMDIYLKEQNVKLNIDKFSSYLKEAYTKVKPFMDNVGQSLSRSRKMLDNHYAT